MYISQVQLSVNLAHSLFFLLLYSLVLTYREGVDMLREAGIDMGYDEDLRYNQGSQRVF